MIFQHKYFSWFVILLIVQNKCDLSFFLKKIHTFQIHGVSSLQGVAILISFLVSAAFHEVNSSTCLELSFLISFHHSLWFYWKMLWHVISFVLFISLSLSICSYVLLFHATFLNSGHSLGSCFRYKNHSKYTHLSSSCAFEFHQHFHSSLYRGM